MDKYFLRRPNSSGLFFFHSCNKLFKTSFIYKVRARELPKMVYLGWDGLFSFPFEMDAFSILQLEQHSVRPHSFSSNKDLRNPNKNTTLLPYITARTKGCFVCVFCLFVFSFPAKPSYSYCISHYRIIELLELERTLKGHLLNLTAVKESSNQLHYLFNENGELKLSPKGQPASQAKLSMEPICTKRKPYNEANRAQPTVMINSNFMRHRVLSS